MSPAPEYVGTARPQVLTFVKPKNVHIRDPSNKSLSKSSSKQPDAIETTKTSNPFRKYLRRLSAHDVDNSSTQPQHPASGKAMLSYSLNVIPAKHGDFYLRTHKQGGLPVLDAASSLALQLCKRHPVACPISTAAADGTGIANRDPKHWLLALVNTSAEVSIVLKARVPSSAVVLPPAKNNKGVKTTQQVLMPLWVVGKDKATGFDTVMKLHILADVVDSNDPDALSGFDCVLSMNALLQYQAVIDLKEGAIVLHERNGSEGGEGKTELAWQERQVVIKGTFSVMPQQAGPLVLWWDNRRKLSPWVTG